SFRTTTASGTTHTTAITYLNNVKTTPGSATCHRLTPMRRKQLIGSRYFKQVIITWSIRSRGNVQRTHIMTKTSRKPLNRNTRTLTTLPTIEPKKVLVSSQGTKPVFQPPRNIKVAMPLTANMLPYSAMKRISQRKPLNSVWKPATNSLSASARSNGARLQLAVAQVKYVQNAAKVNGSLNTSQFTKKPAWRLAT